MSELKLVGLSRDGRQVLFTDDSGDQFTVTADDKLRAALRGDRPRLGQLENEMESALRPRDIQARIRSGATPDEVAAVAQVPVEKILAYCVPVLAERQHIAELARRSHVRRKNTEGPARQLYDVVAERLHSSDIDPNSVSWDAWRRDDGRWAIQASYQSEDVKRTGMLVYDAAGRYCVADDDEARWLTGERPSTGKGPQPRLAGRPGDQPGERRLAAVPSGDDLLSIAEYEYEDDDEATDDLTAVVRAISDPDQAFRPPVEAIEAVETATTRDQVTVDPDGYPRPDVGRDVASVDAPGSDVAEGEVASVAQPALDGGPAATETSVEGRADSSTDSAPPPATEPSSERKRRPNKRPSVPSWDEIMLGGGGGAGSGGGGGAGSGGVGEADKDGNP